MIFLRIFEAVGLRLNIGHVIYEFKFGQKREVNSNKYSYSYLILELSGKH